MSEQQKTNPKKRTRISRPYPQHSLEEVVGIAQAIQSKNAGLPFDRVRLAKSLGTTPSSSAFMMKLNSSVKYSLTKGGYNDPRISLTELGAAVTSSDQDTNRRSLIQAAMRPETFRAFYELLDGKRIPNEDEATGIIVDNIHVPETLAAECLGIVIANGTLVGIVTEVGGSRYVSLSELSEIADQAPNLNSKPEPAVATNTDGLGITRSRTELASEAHESQGRDEVGAGRIFIAHSGAISTAGSIADLLDSFSILYGIFDVDPLDSSPLSPTASAEMDQCSGAIIIFAASEKNPSDPQTVTTRNYKMLLQLGAAFDRFRDKVIKIVGSDVDQDVENNGIRTIRIRDDGTHRFELDLLRELHRTGMIALLVRHRES